MFVDVLDIVEWSSRVRGRSRAPKLNSSFYLHRATARPSFTARARRRRGTDGRRRSLGLRARLGASHASPTGRSCTRPVSAWPRARAAAWMRILVFVPARGGSRRRSQEPGGPRRAHARTPGARDRARSGLLRGRRASERGPRDRGGRRSRGERIERPQGNPGHRHRALKPDVVLHALDFDVPATPWRSSSAPRRSPPRRPRRRGGYSLSAPGAGFRRLRRAGGGRAASAQAQAPGRRLAPAVARGRPHGASAELPELQAKRVDLPTHGRAAVGRSSILRPAGLRHAA